MTTHMKEECLKTRFCHGCQTLFENVSEFEKHFVGFDDKESENHKVDHSPKVGNKRKLG